jgi:hypothetical protein
MSTFKVAALAVALTGGLFTLAPVAAQAQGYGYGYGHGHYQPQYRYAPQPQYVDPRILRKQAQLARRFHEKYGYVQPRPQYGYGYGHGGYGHHQPRGYSYGW